MPKCPDGLELWAILRNVSNTVVELSSDNLNRSGLSESDFRILEVLLHEGPQSVNSIGPKVHLSPGSISVAVDRLYLRELVRRTEAFNDRRIRIVELTKAGTDMIEPACRNQAAIMAKVVDKIASNERILLAQILEKISSRAQQLACEESQAATQP